MLTPSPAAISPEQAGKRCQTESQGGLPSPPRPEFLNPGSSDEWLDLYLLGVGGGVMYTVGCLSAPLVPTN